MCLKVKDPSAGALIRQEANPEQIVGEYGFRIRHPTGSGFFIANRTGTWRSADDHAIGQKFLVNIGLGDGRL